MTPPPPPPKPRLLPKPATLSCVLFSRLLQLQDEIRSEMKDLGTVKDEIMQVSRLNITQPITANAPIAQKHGGQPSQGGAASMPSAPVSQPRASTQHDSFAHPISASPVSAILASQQGVCIWRARGVGAGGNKSGYVENTTKTC
jgi:hypothetical protein